MLAKVAGVRRLAVVMLVLVSCGDGASRCEPVPTEVRTEFTERSMDRWAAVRYEGADEVWIVAAHSPGRTWLWATDDPDAPSAPMMVDHATVPARYRGVVDEASACVRAGAPA